MAATPTPETAPTTTRVTVVTAGLAGLGVSEIAIGIAQGAAPHAFYTAIGPFGPYNAHYARDVATFELAIGIALLTAIARPSWRVPVLAVAALQFALHSLNHLLDVGNAHPAWTGYFDFATLSLATVALAWLTRLAAQERDLLQAQRGRRSG
jgi:uncharacterized membrane protein